MNVKPGDPIKAVLFNSLMEQVKKNVFTLNGSVIKDPLGSTIIENRPLTPNVSGTVVYAQNISETFTQKPGYVCGILGFPESLDINKRYSVVTVDKVTEDNQNNFAVVLDFIKPGKIGRIMISGITFVSTEGEGFPGNFGFATAGSHLMQVGDSGSARILYNAPEKSKALIQFGGIGGGSSTSWQFVWNEGPDL